MKLNHEKELKLQEDKLVKYLHQEYAKKHTSKMRELKEYYEDKLKRA